MNLSRLVFTVVVGYCLLCPESLFAQVSAAPFEISRQFSADEVITGKDGTVMTQKIYSDTGKMRLDITTHGMQVISIVRPDLKKIYSLLVAQKMVMEIPYDAEKIKKQIVNAAGLEGKFEVIGPDTVDGVACTKYKVTSEKDNKVFFFWIDPSTKAPVKMMAEDNSTTILWKNFKAGPQDAALFEVPADYKMMTMPGGAGQ